MSIVIKAISTRPTVHSEWYWNSRDPAIRRVLMELDGYYKNLNIMVMDSETNNGLMFTRSLIVPDSDTWTLLTALIKNNITDHVTNRNQYIKNNGQTLLLEGYNEQNAVFFSIKAV